MRINREICDNFLYQPAKTETEITSSDGNASGDDRDHTLPFKVIGVAFKDVRAQKFPRTDFFKTLTAGRK